MGSPQSGSRLPAHDVVVVAAGVTPGLRAALIRRAVRTVLQQEDEGPATVHVNFLSSQRMRALNRRTFQRDRATDVIAFRMRHDGALVGDVYVCPPTARRSAVTQGVPFREELVRLIVHGTLHVLGHDHPEAHDRTTSSMWRRQEQYVHDILGRRT